MATYEPRRCYFKQGDDLSSILEEVKKENPDADHTPIALRKWSEDLLTASEYLKNLADKFEGKNIETHADCHFISFEAEDTTILDELVKEDLLDREDWDEEDGCYCDNECGECETYEEESEL